MINVKVVEVVVVAEGCCYCDSVHPRLRHNAVSAYLTLHEGSCREPIA